MPSGFPPEETIGILVWKKGGAHLDEIYEQIKAIAEAIDDGSTPYDVDMFTDNVIISADNVEPGWGRDEYERDAEGRVLAGPYCARLCPDCDTWIYTAAGPFAEGDPTKTLADMNHWEREHDEVKTLADEAERVRTEPIVLMRPFMQFNKEPVWAVLEEGSDR